MKELPDVKSIEKALQLAAASIEGAKYLCLRFEQKVFALNLEKLDTPDLANHAKLLQGQLTAFAKYVDCQLRGNSDAWSGRLEQGSTTFEKLHASLAAEGAKSIESNAEGNEYTMHIAVSDEGEVLRAYTAESIDLATTMVFEGEPEAALETQQSQGL
ncbi:hypothetical protein [Legionella sp. km772]|uniref:hypothetical protein n=1 Tax=Legionella sp. km772 TaxID=2498111 RepID=UPI000F8ED495|nr:hypothetical protein [Legionella sp. km772]RUR12450.1 hypothetical protein ELY15_05020 [Legionella sp. km772]